MAQACAGEFREKERRIGSCFALPIWPCCVRGVPILWPSESAEIPPQVSPQSGRGPYADFGDIQASPAAAAEFRVIPRKLDGVETI